MNFLSHYVFNRDVCKLTQGPYFVMGVALPDLWPRFSRTRRLNWSAVRGFQASDAIDVDLRAGLLNHIAADHLFHGLPAFARWQRELKGRVDAGDVCGATLEFLCHVTIELVMDRQLMASEPQLADTFYDCLELCNLAIVERRVGIIGSVDSLGLSEILRRFVDRRYLQRYATDEGLLHVVRRLLDITSIEDELPDRFLVELFSAAGDIIELQVVWREMGSRPLSPKNAG